nr:hypothetical protein [Tanacetum cinerariifolium]
MTTLAEHIIVAGAENRPPMLDKSMYDSWKFDVNLLSRSHMIETGNAFISLEQTLPILVLDHEWCSSVREPLVVEKHRQSPFLSALIPHLNLCVTHHSRPQSLRFLPAKAVLMENLSSYDLEVLSEQLAFLADPGISEALVAQQRIPQNSAFQTEDLDTYDSDYNDLSSAKAVLMENLSSYDLEVLSEVPFSILI